MPQDGEILLENLKAFYSIDDIKLVDKNKIDQANECRLYFEITWSVGVAISGSLFTSATWPTGITSFCFIGVSVFFLIRYIMKQKLIGEQMIKFVK
jgi:hypothetical protein